MSVHFENLDEPLLRFGDEPDANAFTIRSSFESCLCIGNTGSGKSSGVARELVGKMMEKKYGMLLLTAKELDAETYKHYAAIAGRSADVIEVTPSATGGHAFNFMHYESTAKTGLSFARNLLDLLKVVIEAGEERTQGAEADPFWRNSSEMLIRSAIHLLLLAYGEVTIPMLYEVAQTAPHKEDKPTQQEEETTFQKVMTLAKKRVKEQVDAWKAKVGEDYWKALADEKLAKEIEDAVPDYRTLMMVRNFFMESLFNISEKTRGIIILSFTTFLSRLLDEPIYSLFCNRPSTFTPESCIETGKLVIINLPVSLYGRIGQDIQIMIKYIFQKAWQRRNVKLNGRPLAIVCDEAQLFLHPLDSALLATARSSRIATFYLTQNLPAFHSNIGGNGTKAEAKVDALMSLLSTKIFLCNSCVKTNRWASDIIGKGYTEDPSTSMSGGDNFSFGQGSRYMLEDIVRPEHFAQLKNGGPLNNYKVQGIIHMQSRRFNNGFNHKKINFKQQF